jgi:hypothetical protein
MSPKHVASSGCGWRNGLQLWRVATTILSKQPRTNSKGWSSRLVLSVELTTLHTTQATEYGYEIRIMECKEFV